MSHLHATALLLGDRGLLIQGGSGAGKSTLALALLRRAELAGRFARLVCDDQVELAANAGRLVASAPASIAGLVEVHGLSPVSVAYEARAVIDLVVRLVDHSEAPRFQEQDEVALAGCRLPVLDLPSRNVEASAGIVHARLGLEPF
ncbi:MAG TPA: HPr kinase/phosphorylase [Rhizobiaceae bacterium]|nr:HPr kinase/phosphorylase [Rhizobiaceae bacterium]